MKRHKELDLESWEVQKGQRQYNRGTTGGGNLYHHPGYFED